MGSPVGWVEVMASATAILEVAAGGGWGVVMDDEVEVVAAGSLMVMVGRGRVEAGVV